MILVGLFNQNYGSLPINVSKVKALERRMLYLYLSVSSELFFLLKTSFFLFIFGSGFFWIFFGFVNIN